MTNAEKYLKDGVDIEEFALKLHRFMSGNEEAMWSYKSAITTFLKEQIKPTLTEDERAILRNIDKKFYKIGRTDDNTIYFIFEEITGKEAKYYANVFDNIFQFIKNGEEYEIKELIDNASITD